MEQQASINIRRYSNWRSIVAVALVGTAAAVCIFLFHDHAQGQRYLEKTMVRLDLLAHELSSLEWQAIAGRRLDQEMDEKVRSSSAASRDILTKLQRVDPDGRKLRDVVAAFDAYIVAMEEEFRLLRAGDVEGAVRQDEKRVDPAFAVLDREVDAAVALYSNTADLGYRIAEGGATASILLAVALISWLLSRAGRAKLLQLQTEQDALRRSMEFSQTVMESINDSVAIIDAADYRVLGCNAAFRGNFGPTGTELIGKSCYELIHNLIKPCDGANNKCPLAETVRTGKHATAEHVHDTGTNEKAYVEVSTSPVLDKNGKVEKVVYLVRDITERKRMEQALLESEEKFRSLAEKSLVGVYLIQDGIFRYLNPKMTEIFGYSIEEMVGGMGPRDLTLADDWPTVQENLRKRISGEIDSVHYEFRGVTKAGKTINLEVYGCRTALQGEPAVIGTLLDITDRKRAELALTEQARELAHANEELRNMSLTDELTGLYNRRGFVALAEHHLKMTERLKKNTFITFVDLDGLKAINDTLGHQEGDNALKDTANLLREIFRESDIIARLAGDEFVVLAMSSNHEGDGTVASRIEKGLARVNVGNNRRYRLSVSMGTAHYDPLSPCSVEELIARADAMMYARKIAKKGEGNGPPLEAGGAA